MNSFFIQMPDGPNGRHVQSLGCPCRQHVILFQTGVMFFVARKASGGANNIPIISDTPSRTDQPLFPLLLIQRTVLLPTVLPLTSKVFDLNIV